MRSLVRAFFLVAFVAGGIAVPYRTVAAQYFGQNKVEYQSFDFKVLKTEHFDIYYYPEEEPGVAYAAMMAERWYARLSRLLDHELSGRQALILYASGAQFRQTNVTTIDGEGTGGVTEILKRRIVLPFAGPLKETDHVIGHELVHAFQFDMTGEGGGILRSGGPAIQRYPLWFIEGMAEFLSLGPEDANTAMWMRDAVREDKLPDLGRLSDPRFFPYRYGQALLAYVSGRWGDDVIGKITKASRGAQLGPAFQRFTGEPADSVVKDWQDATQKAYKPLLDMTETPDKYGSQIIKATRYGGATNVAPVLSPDGQWLAFISARNLFSYDMYLADAHTGEIKKRIVRTDVDPHFESIQFISSAGAWSRDSRRLVFAAIVEGRPSLSILNVPEDKIEREVRLPSLGDVLNPTWSPDGRYLAFSAQAGGLTNLYVYDLQENQLRQLTKDAFADLQPEFSPDGRSLAFVTDRFSTQLSNLSFGNYRLALYDMATGNISELPGFPSGKHINPQWSPDGKSIYFLSDQDGITNAYRLEVATGAINQVTNLYAGISGITDLSPAISVASGTGDLAMSVYSYDGFNIYRVNNQQVLAGESVAQAFPGGDPALLPPRQRVSNELVTLKANSFFGLPQDTMAFETHPYHPSLALDYIGQPSFVVGSDAFGTFVGGGTSLYWSDMLGGHNLATAVQVQGSFKDVGGLLAYWNLNHRLNWGASLQQFPYLAGAYGPYDTATVQGILTLKEQFFLYRQTMRQASWNFAYPFSRARRLEGSVGFDNVTFSYEVRNTYFEPTTGAVIAHDKTSLEAPSALNLAVAQMAYVYDNTFFGNTGPVLGQRYRLDATTYNGSLNFESALVDFRKYIMPVRPFTLAGRLTHYGRWGKDADNFNRLQPLFIGYDGWVRGYQLGSFSAAECGQDPNCPVYTNLFGSKTLIGSAELRFPLLGVLGVGGPFGFLPLDVFFFGDGGIAWDNTSTASKAFFLGGDRKPVYSAGGGLRFNLFGYAILEFALVHPFNRPLKTTLFQFSLVPGF